MNEASQKLRWPALLLPSQHSASHREWFRLTNRVSAVGRWYRAGSSGCLGGSAQGPCWVAGHIQASLGEPEREVQWGCQNPEDLGEPGKEATGSYRKAAGSVMEKGWRGWAVPVAGLYLLVLLQVLRASVLEGSMLPGDNGECWSALLSCKWQKGNSEMGHKPKSQKAEPAWGTHSPGAYIYWTLSAPPLCFSRGWPSFAHLWLPS